jgi:hypothetical protein
MVRTIQQLLDQVEANQKCERHHNYQETVYWCRQWRRLAEEFAIVFKDLANPPLTVKRKRKRN